MGYDKRYARKYNKYTAYIYDNQRNIFYQIPSTPYPFVPTNSIMLKNGDILFAGGIFTNLTRDHLDYHKTFDNYLKAKQRFFDGLSHDAFALTNDDDRNGRVMVQNTKAHVYTYSRQGDADFRAVVMESHFEGMMLMIDGQEVAVQNNRFDVLYEGRYTLTYTATDYSGNTGTKVVRVTARLPQGAAQMRFDTLPEASGRKGVEYILPCPEVYVDGVPASIPVQVRVVEPDGTEQMLVFETGESEKKFIPEQIGDYEFYYSVSNDVATVYMFYDASIKLNVAAQDSYKDVFSSDSWIGSGIRETENGILISASAYCPLPFEMSSGIELTIDLSGLGNKKAGAEDFIDCWAALAIGCAPQNTLFSAPVEGFIYFMFYREDSNYYINVLARCNGVDYGILNGYLLGESKEAVISVQKRTDSETYADNVYIYVNHTLADVATSSMISYSDITDNENFCYVSVSNFGSSFQTAETYKSLTIKKVTVCDQEDPTVQMSGIWIEEAKVGQTIVLPEVTVTDNLNNGLRMKVSFYAPDGKEIEYRAGNFTPDSVGVYYLIIKAVDDAGNDKLSVYSLNVTSEKEFPVGIIIGIVCGAAAFVACVVAAAVIIKKKYGKKARNE